MNPRLQVQESDPKRFAEMAPRPPLILTLLFVICAAALAWEAWQVGVTFDEPYDLVASYVYWQGGGVTATSETPPLTHIACGWIPSLFGITLRQDTEAWRTHNWHEIGTVLLAGMDAEQARQLIFFSRLPFLVFPLLIGWLIWLWGRQLFGEWTALGLAAATLLDPNLLAHGALIKSDVPAAFGLLWCAYASWKFWQQPDLRRVSLLALSLTVAILTKFTLMVMVPFVAVLVAVRYSRQRNPKAAAAALAVVVLGTYLGVIVAYQFHVALPDAEVFREMQRVDSWEPQEVARLRLFRYLPLPPDFVRGFRFVARAGRNQGFPAYMMGHRIEYAEPAYFPLALAVKYPIPLQLLSLAGLAALAARLWRRRAGPGEFFVWTPGILMFALAMQGHAHIGFRYILPCVPFFVLGGGFALEWLRASRAGLLTVAAGLLWLAGASVFIYPQGLAYFNEWIGGPNQGWRYLADSNIDWGQDLPSLGRYVRDRGMEKIKLVYFGKDVIEHYIEPNQFEEVPGPFCPACVKEKQLTPEPGVYAISVNQLLGYFFDPEYRNYFRYFLDRSPDAKAGYSIFIYHVAGPPPAAVHAVYGPPARLSFTPSAVTPGEEYTIACPDLAGRFIDLRYRFRNQPPQEAEHFCRLNSKGKARIRVPTRFQPGTIAVMAVRATGAAEWRPAAAAISVR